MRRVVDHPLRAGRPGVSCTARLSNASDRERPCPAVQELLRESNDLVEPEEGRILDEEYPPLLAAYQLIERAVGALERIGRELKRYNDREAQVSEETAESMPMNEKLVKRE